MARQNVVKVRLDFWLPIDPADAKSVGAAAEKIEHVKAAVASEGGVPTDVKTTYTTVPK